MQTLHIIITIVICIAIYGIGSGRKISPKALIFFILTYGLFFGVLIFYTSEKLEETDVK